jgi:hypothetical protein
MPESPEFSAQAAVAAIPGLSPGVTRGRDLIPLRAMYGQDEVNHGTNRYLVDGHLVWVPREAVGPLIAVGGFAELEVSDSRVSAGTVTVRHAATVACSYGGRQYVGDASGDFVVPAEAVRDLRGHGFVPTLPGVSPFVVVTEHGAGNRSRNR